MEILIFSGEKFKLVERGRNGREMAYGKRIGTGGVILRFQEKRETIRKKAEDPSRGSRSSRGKDFGTKEFPLTKKRLPR